MNISYSNSQPLTTEDLSELQQFEHRLESCTSDGILYFEDLESALKNSRVNHKLITRKLAIIRQTAWQKIESGSLKLDWRPYRKL